ncbi:MAG: hypothetical protein AVDCRST_MAG78-3385, partial [uncultured Rubrobacteraceae bacterium]
GRRTTRSRWRIPCTEQRRRPAGDARSDQEPRGRPVLRAPGRDERATRWGV